MTTSEYLTNIKIKYPNTYIGLNAFYKAGNPNKVEFLIEYGKVPLDYVISIIVSYIEYRQVIFLEALCNTHFDFPNDNHQALRLKTVTTILHRLEKHIHPVEGQPF